MVFSEAALMLMTKFMIADIPEENATALAGMDGVGMM